MNSKTLFSPQKQFQINITKLIELSKYLDKDIKYSNEINPQFIKQLFHDLRNGSKWYEDQQWRPIKTAIHNCYKLCSNGFANDCQRELENNIIILDKLLKEPNPKRIRLEQWSAQVVQNIFDTTWSALTKKAILQEDIRKSFQGVPENVQKEFETFEKGKAIPNEIVDRVVNKDKDYNYYEQKLKEQKEFYENKLTLMNDRICNLEEEIRKIKLVFQGVNCVFGNYK